MKSYRRIKSVELTIAILKFMAKEIQPVSGQEIAKALEEPHGTIMCHLVTLEEGGFIKRVYERYEIGVYLGVLWASIKASRGAMIDSAQLDLRKLVFNQKEKIMRDVNVDALNDAIDVTAKESEVKLAKLQNEIGAIREESRALGILQKINYDNAHNELLKHAMFFQVKQSKGYKDDGMTWEEFCTAAGENVRKVDRALKDLKPIYDDFSDKLSGFLNIPFNKIKYLGRSFSDNLSKNENGELILGEERIPLTPDNKDEIEAAIDTLIESHKKEQKELKTKLQKAKKNTDKIVEEETKGLTAERDALVKVVARLKEFDPAEKDISWAEEHLSGLKDLVAQFDVGVRRMVMDERLHEAMDVQARCQVFIDTMVRQARGLQRDWDAEFNSEDL